MPKSNEQAESMQWNDHPVTESHEKWSSQFQSNTLPINAVFLNCSYIQSYFFLLYTHISQVQRMTHFWESVTSKNYRISQQVKCRILQEDETGKVSFSTQQCTKWSVIIFRSIFQEITSEASGKMVTFINCEHPPSSQLVSISWSSNYNKFHLRIHCQLPLFMISTIKSITVFYKMWSTSKES